jgi:hypothetical protein
MKTSMAFAFFLVIVSGAYARDKVTLPPPAPLPDVVTHAKVVMLTSEVGSTTVYDEAYKCLKQWGRFALVGNPEKADLIIAVQSDLSERSLGIRDILLIPPPRPLYMQYLYLVIRDPKTDQVVWADKQLQRFAFRQENRDKETLLAVDVLFDRLRDRVPKN